MLEDEGNEMAVDLGHRTSCEFEDQGASEDAFGHGENAVLATGAGNGIHLPMTDFTTSFNCGWPFRDVAFAR